MYKLRKAENCIYVRNELEYLGFKISRKGIMPLPNKVEAIKTYYFFPNLDYERK